MASNLSDNESTEQELFENEKDVSYIYEQNEMLNFEEATLDYYNEIKYYVNSTGFNIGSKMSYNDLLVFLRNNNS